MYFLNIHKRKVCYAITIISLFCGVPYKTSCSFVAFLQRIQLKSYHPTYNKRSLKYLS